MKVIVNSIAHDQIYSASKHPNISVGKEYMVLAIEDDYYRILNDENEPILYEKEIFNVLDSSIPSDWIKKEYDEGEYYIYPPDFLEFDYFFEKYFDGDKEVIGAFNKYLKKINQ